MKTVILLSLLISLALAQWSCLKPTADFPAGSCEPPDFERYKQGRKTMPCASDSPCGVDGVPCLETVTQERNPKTGLVEDVSACANDTVRELVDIWSCKPEGQTVPNSPEHPGTCNPGPLGRAQNKAPQECATISFCDDEYSRCRPDFVQETDPVSGNPEWHSDCTNNTAVWWTCVPDDSPNHGPGVCKAYGGHLGELGTTQVCHVNNPCKTAGNGCRPDSQWDDPNKKDRKIQANCS